MLKKSEFSSDCSYSSRSRTKNFRVIGLIATHDSGPIATHVSGLITTSPCKCKKWRSYWRAVLRDIGKRFFCNLWTNVWCVQWTTTRFEIRLLPGNFGVILWKFGRNLALLMKIGFSDKNGHRKYDKNAEKTRCRLVGLFQITIIRLWPRMG